MYLLGVISLADLFIEEAKSPFLGLAIPYTKKLSYLFQNSIYTKLTSEMITCFRTENKLKIQPPKLLIIEHPILFEKSVPLIKIHAT